ncbi:hypothetical protein [Amycolatopsis sp. GA6-003]
MEYALTGLGRNVGVLTGALADWSKADADRIHAARAAYDDGKD